MLFLEIPTLSPNAENAFTNAINEPLLPFTERDALLSKALGDGILSLEVKLLPNLLVLLSTKDEVAYIDPRLLSLELFVRLLFSSLLPFIILSNILKLLSKGRDREEENDVVYGSLTDCLNQVFIVHKATQFFVDAKKGEVYLEDGVEKPQPVKKYSLYGEEV